MRSLLQNFTIHKKLINFKNKKNFILVRGIKYYFGGIKMTINVNSSLSYGDLQKRIDRDSQASSFCLANTYYTPVDITGLNNNQQTQKTQQNQTQQVQQQQVVQQVAQQDQTQQLQQIQPKTKAKKGFWNGAWHVLKGGFNFFKGMVCDENGDISLGQIAKTVGIGLAIGAATVLIPGAGTVLALGMLGMGAYHSVKSGVEIYNAKTEEEYEQACENLGSGLTEAALARFACKKVGAFKSAGNALKTIRANANNLRTAYKNGGVSSLKTEAEFQFAEMRTALETRYDATQTNWKNMTSKDARLNRMKESYNERISKAKGAEKTKLQNELRAYEDGYAQVATETDYSTAANTLETLESALKTAREAAMKPKATAAQKATFQQAQARYSAAKTTLETRVQAGEFKVTTKRALNKLDSNIKKAKTDLENARKALDGTDAKKAAYETAQKAYNKALNIKKAAEGETGRTFRLRAAAADGLKKPGTGWLTLTAAGRGYLDKSEGEYVVGPDGNIYLAA